MSRQFVIGAMRIVTELYHPEWMAVPDGYQEGYPIGVGDTEVEAALDLVAKIKALPVEGTA